MLMMVEKPSGAVGEMLQFLGKVKLKLQISNFTPRYTPKRLKTGIQIRIR